jgi:hypothetical protein
MRTDDELDRQRAVCPNWAAIPLTNLAPGGIEGGHSNTRPRDGFDVDGETPRSHSTRWPYVDLEGEVHLILDGWIGRNCGGRLHRGRCRRRQSRHRAATCRRGSRRGRRGGNRARNVRKPLFVPRLCRRHTAVNSKERADTAHQHESSRGQYGKNRTGILGHDMAEPFVDAGRVRRGDRRLGGSTSGAPSPPRYERMTSSLPRRSADEPVSTTSPFWRT